MLPELSEKDARGETAVIYGEIRDLCGIAYVSSLQRHLATRPGWLEWAWALVRPVFVTGMAQHAAWAACARVEAAPLPALSAEALALLGVDRPGQAAIRNVCENFIRASPTNLVFSGLVGHVLRGTAAPGAAMRQSVVPAVPPLPAPLPPPVPMVQMGDAAEPLAALLLRIGTTVDSEPFVPGLYRMLARWPACFAHLATELLARMETPQTKQACAALREAADGATLAVLPHLPPPGDSPPRPPEASIAAVLAAMERYRVTSPEMILFSTLIRDALPQGTG